MKKKFIGLVLSAVLFALCTAAEAQQPGKIPRIGLSEIGSQRGQASEPFLQGLRDLGYVEGKNIVIEYRYAEGKPNGCLNLQPNWSISKWT